jgi:hypothetical protein
MLTMNLYNGTDYVAVWDDGADHSISFEARASGVNATQLFMYLQKYGRVDGSRTTTITQSHVPKAVRFKEVEEEEDSDSD